MTKTGEHEFAGLARGCHCRSTPVTYTCTKLYTAYILVRMRTRVLQPEFAAEYPKLMYAICVENATIVNCGRSKYLRENYLCLEIYVCNKIYIYIIK